MNSTRPVALVTGVGRTIGIGAGIASRLASSGWDIAFTYWNAYDQRMTWGIEVEAATDVILADLAGHGAILPWQSRQPHQDRRSEEIFGEAEQRLGGVTALVMCHCESVDSGLLDTTLGSFDRHFAVNAGAAWLRIGADGLRFRGRLGPEGVVALTSDATIGNLPYGASKGCARWHHL